MNQGKPGFTMIELLIVVSIIALLIALLLPAVQSAREGANRAACRNNLMQLGIAFASYASTHSVLPPGVVSEHGPIRNLPVGFHHSWAVQILPFIGEPNAYNHFNLKLSAYDSANDTVAGITIKTLICPSTRQGPSYAGCHNDTSTPIDSNNHGVLYLNSRVGYDEVIDGTAYTILLGEILNWGPSLGWTSGTRSTLRDTGTAVNDFHAFNQAAKVAPGTPGRSDRDELFETIAALAEDGLWPVELTGGFASKHPESCNFLFCNGSVRAVPRSVNAYVYRCLGNRADGEPISSNAY
jgi:prepilin-type N-terminal cleavage/methylation domain-containing protein